MIAVLTESSVVSKKREKVTHLLKMKPKIIVKKWHLLSWLPISLG